MGCFSSKSAANDSVQVHSAYRNKPHIGPGSASSDSRSIASAKSASTKRSPFKRHKVGLQVLLLDTVSEGEHMLVSD